MKQYLYNHFVGYIIHITEMILSKEDLINSTISKQQDENAIVLGRWCLLSSIDPGINRGYSIKNLIENPNLSLKDFLQKY